jgi:hypothetical protein
VTVQVLLAGDQVMVRSGSGSSAKASPASPWQQKPRTALLIEAVRAASSGDALKGLFTRTPDISPW